MATISTYADYPLGEAGSLTSNNRPIDISGNGRNFTSEINGPGASTGTAGVSAPGSTAYLDSSGTGNEGWYSGNLFTSLPTDNFAFGIYVNAAANTSDTQGTFFSLGGSGGAFNFSLEGGGWQASSFNQAYIGDAGTFTADTWVHLALIRSGGVATFYVNGVATGGSYAGAPVHDTPHLSVKPGGSQYFDGKLDEARVVTFSAGESAANVLTALQQGVMPTSFVFVGPTASYTAANLSTDEQSNFRLGGAVTDFATVRSVNGLSIVAGTAPKHIINITQQGSVAAGAYPLIKYSGTLGGLGLSGLQLGAMGRLSGTLVNNTTNSTIDLQVTVGSATGDVTWTGANGGAWDVQTTANWKFTFGGTPTQFFSSDIVRLDDSAATGALTLTGAVQPSGVLINNSALNYTFSGTGISGAATLTKSGTGMVTFNNPNSYSGATQINAGTLRVGTGGSPGAGNIVNNGALVFDHTSDVNAMGAISGNGTLTKSGNGTLILGGSNSFTGAVQLNGGIIKSGNPNCLGNASAGTVVAAGATLDVNAVGFGAEPLVINGTGTAGQGAIINSSSAGQVSAVQSLTLASDSTVGGTGRWDVRGDFSTLGGNFKLTKIGALQISLVDTDVSVKSIDVNEGLLTLELGTIVDNTHPGFITVNSGAVLGLASYWSAISCSKPIVLNGGLLETATGGSDGNATLVAPVTLAAVSNVINARGGSTLTLNGSISGNGRLEKTGPGTLVLGAAPAYTGTTRITDGVLTLSQPGLANPSTVDISTTGVLNMNFSGDEQVSILLIDGVQMPSGRYDSTDPSGRFTGTGALVVGSSGPYADWETANGIAGAGPAADSDGDGISNGIEFVVGGNPGSPDSGSSALLPVFDMHDTYVIFSFRRTAASAAFNPHVQYGSDLAEWIDAQDGTDGVQVAVDNEFYGAGIDRVGVLIPRPPTESLFFVRLKVGLDP